MKEVRRELRFFELMRDEDISGVSGIGLVAVGVVFPSGRVVLEWLGSRSTFGIYNNLADVERIHGHDGKTRVLFSKGTTCNSYLAFQRPRAKSVLQVVERIDTDLIRYFSLVEKGSPAPEAYL